jgi:HK97 family phage major capsid protein
MMSGASIGAARKLKASTSGEYLFTPTLDAATPDRLLGFPIRENPHVAGAGTTVKSVLFGHMPSFYTRVVGGLQVARSDEFAFNTDLVTLRYILRIDGALPQSSHIKYFVGGAS